MVKKRKLNKDELYATRGNIFTELKNCAIIRVMRMPAEHTLPGGSRVKNWMNLVFALVFAFIWVRLGYLAIHKGVLFTNPVITTYPLSWPMMLAGFILLVACWFMPLHAKLMFALPSAGLGLAAYIIALPKACIAGFAGFAMLACLLCIKPFSAVFHSRLRPMPQWASSIQSALVGAAFALLVASIASYSFPPPPK